MYTVANRSRNTSSAMAEPKRSSSLRSGGFRGTGGSTANTTPNRRTGSVGRKPIVDGARMVDSGSDSSPTTTPASPNAYSATSYMNGSPTWNRRSSLGSEPRTPKLSPTTQGAPIVPELGNDSFSRSSSNSSFGGGSYTANSTSLPTPKRGAPLVTNNSFSHPPRGLNEAPPAPAPTSLAGQLTQAPQTGGATVSSLYARRDRSNSMPPLSPSSKTNAFGSNRPGESPTAAKLRKIKSQSFNLSPCRSIVQPMLSPPSPDKASKMLLVLDIDETLVHASFTPETPHDCKVKITVGNETGTIYVAFRPHLKTFLSAVAPLFEVAIFTASQSCYANQLMDIIDPRGELGRHRLFREHCTEVNGARVKDLSLLGRPLDRCMIIDNSPVAYLFQPRNAIPILSWFDDPSDTELLKLLPMLRQLAEEAKVYDVLDEFNASLE